MISDARACGGAAMRVVSGAESAVARRKREFHFMFR
jgi:hypothetical protein